VTTDAIAAIADLDERPLAGRQRYAAILVACGEFIDGYDLLVMGGALILIRPQFGLTPQEVGLLGAAAFLGAMAGLLVFGDLSDRIGRRAIFIVNLFFFVVFAIASAFVTTTAQLFVMRFLVGVGVGMDIPTSTAYLAEIAPRRRRGAMLGSLLNIMWTLGAMTSTLIALPLLALAGDAAWRWMLGLAAVPAILILLGRQGLPESPRWLLSRGRVEEARRAFAAFGIDATADMLAATPRRGSYAELFRPPYLNRVIWVGLWFTFNCFAGSVATIATPLVIKTVGAISTDTTLFFSASIWAVATIGVMISSMLVDRIGRRKLSYISSAAFIAFALLQSRFAETSPVALVACFYGMSLAGWSGNAILGWIWSSELFPTHLRGRSQGICNGLCRLAISANIFLVPIALAGIGFGAYVGLLALLLMANVVIVATHPMLEGNQKSLEELAT
jgi:MFS transporter, putative metabolite transport protein